MTREEVVNQLKIELSVWESDCKSYHKTKDAIKYAIKALEQQSNEDCVDREELKKWLDMNFSFGGALRKIELFDRLDKELPPVTPTQKWIPCSERLPKPGEFVDDDVAKYYLVQNEYGDMLVARYTHSEYWEQIYQMEPIGDEVVAWMPLPKQYKAEMESNACKDCYYNDGEVHAECVVCDKDKSGH